MPKPLEKETASRRTALKPGTYDNLRSLAQGFGCTQDEMVGLLIRMVLGPGDDPVITGHKMRKTILDLQERQKEQANAVDPG